MKKASQTTLSGRQRVRFGERDALDIRQRISLMRQAARDLGAAALMYALDPGDWGEFSNMMTGQAVVIEAHIGNIEAGLNDSAKGDPLESLAILAMMETRAVWFSANLMAERLGPRECTERLQELAIEIEVHVWRCLEQLSPEPSLALN
jgi:hypothetical protein